MPGVVLAVLAGLVTSLAVTVTGFPTGSDVDLSVMLKVFVPITRGASAGRTASGSFELKVNVSVTVVTLFQYWSTALTVALNAVPASSGDGVGGHAE